MVCRVVPNQIKETWQILIFPKNEGYQEGEPTINMNEMISIDNNDDQLLFF